NDQAYSKLISDSAANISVLGDNWYVVERSMRTIDIVGFAEDLERKDVPIVNAITKTILPSGKSILLQVNEEAYLSKGDSLLSKIQVGSSGIHVDDDLHFGSGYIMAEEQFGANIPLKMELGMVYVQIEIPTEEDLEKLSVMVLTSDMPWNPANIKMPIGFANAIKGTVSFENEKEKIKKLATRLGTVNLDIVKKTLNCTTWMGKLDPRIPLRRHIKARLPHMGLVRINEKISMDTVYPSKTITMKDYNGFTCAQIFVGMESTFIFIVLMKAEKDGPGALQDFIRFVGCPLCLHNDRSKMQLNEEIKKICRNAYIPQSTTETYHPWQNPTERRTQEIKKVADYFMDTSCAPVKAWSHALMHAAWCLNRLATKSLGYITPYEYARGETPDLSVLQFNFWEQLYYLDPLSRFPQPSERPGRFLGIADYIGDAMTYWILNEKNQIIARSCVRPVDDEKRINIRALERMPKSILKEDMQRHVPMTRADTRDCACIACQVS
ncbi:MAG: hypothetical protein ACREBR_00110, partial [bacterium]